MIISQNYHRKSSGAVLFYSINCGNILENSGAFNKISGNMAVNSGAMVENSGDRTEKSGAITGKSGANTEFSGDQV